ncbi:MAG: hypothetical protein NT090_15925, partial [Acidobacteria bacterium]|nr:hypothetical protein [Acidobacteriota bacterium]
DKNGQPRPLSAKQITYQQCPDTMARAKMVRTEEWKMVIRLRGGNELYSLHDDPWELNNLAADPAHTGRVRELTTLMKSWMKKTDDPVDLDRPDWGVKPEAGQAACDCAAPGYQEC